MQMSKPLLRKCANEKWEMGKCERVLSLFCNDTAVFSAFRFTFQLNFPYFYIDNQFISEIFLRLFSHQASCPALQACARFVLSMRAADTRGSCTAVVGPAFCLRRPE
jgi:hypothetical protein